MASSNSTPYSGLLMRLLLVLLAALFMSCGGQQPRAGGAAEPTPQAATAPSPIPWKTIEPPSQVVAPTGTPKAQQSPVVMTFSGTGVIRLINLKEGWLEIDHEEIPGVMAAMQMEWSVKDRAMLKSIRVGDKVNFTVEDNNGSEVIIALTKAPAAP